MGRFSFLVILTVALAMVFFAIYNQDTTTVVVPFVATYEVSKIALMLMACAFGAGMIFLLFAARDTSRLVHTYQYQKKQKRESRIEALYNKAVNRILGQGSGEARRTLTEILKIEPQHTDSLLRLGNLEELDGKLEGAADYYKLALASSPKCIEALFALGDVMDKLGRLDEALSYMDRLLDIDPDSIGALYRKRSALERKNRWDDVISVQKNIIKLTEETRKEHEQKVLLGYRYELGRDSLERGEVEKASSVLRGILREDEAFLPAHLGVAEAMLLENDVEGAVSYLEKTYASTKSQIVLARLEDLIISMGEPSRLIRIYMKAIADNPNNELLRFFLGKLYFRLEMVEDAFEVLRAPELSEALPEVSILLGELYLRRDQCARAVEQFKKTVGLGRALRVPYCCSHCGRREEEWSGRCPGCGQWNTFRFNIKEPCKHAPA